MKKIGENRYRKSFGRYYEDFSIGNVYVHRPAGNRDVLVKILDDEFRRRPTQEWIQLLGGRVPAAPVLTLPQALDNPYVRDTGGMLTLALSATCSRWTICTALRSFTRRP